MDQKLTSFHLEILTKSYRYQDKHYINLIKGNKFTSDSSLACFGSTYFELFLYRTGCRGPRPHTYLMDVAESNVTESSCMSNLKCSAHFSLSSLPSLVRVDKQTFLHIRHVAVSTNMPVLEPSHCPVKPLAGQKKFAGHFFLTEAEAKTSVSEERPPGRRGYRPANHLMVMATRNISEPLCESDLKNTAPLSLPRLPSFASRPVRVDKRTSLLGHHVDVSTKMPVLEPTRVVKRLADPQKRCSVVVARNLTSFQGI